MTPDHNIDKQQVPEQGVMMPNRLPVVREYTFDARFQEFRRCDPVRAFEFIPLDSAEGQELLAALLDEGGGP